MKNLPQALFLYLGVILVLSCSDACMTGRSSVINGSSRRIVNNGEQDLLINGSLDVAKITVRNLTVNGSAHLGPQQSFIEDLTVNGSLRGENLRVKNEAIISGSAHIKASHFDHDVRVAGSLELEQSVIEGNLLISQKLTIKNGVTIKGYVEFTKEPGKVMIKGRDIHLLGGVINGTAEESGTKPHAPPVHF